MNWTAGLLMLLTAGLVHAADDSPYASLGFLKFPDDVKLDAVSAVAIGPRDEIFVLQRGEPPLVAFSADGEYLRGWGTGLFKVPHGLRFDREGLLWTTDNGNHVLRRFRTDGTLVSTLGEEGKPAKGAAGFRAPDDLVFDRAGNIFVADSGNARIVRLDSSGAFLGEFGSKGKADGQFATAHGLAIDSDDRIYVADRGNKRVQVFDSQGKHLANWAGFGNPFGLIWAGDELIASEGDVHKLAHMNRSGEITKTWGDPELLKLPHLMAVNSQGHLFVAEVNGKRIQRFRPVK